MQKHQTKKVVINIRETCEETMFTPFNPITLAARGLEELFFPVVLLCQFFGSGGK
jgi:hypothetical protein